MSASTIARWNAIPLSTSEDPDSLKRKSVNDGDGDDDDDDDVSLVSRTPSPVPEAMDVDADSVSKYDEYVRGVAHEVITVETRIKPNNKGFALLAKLGWTEGQPLGLSGDGRVEPVPFQMKSDSTGLGKVNQDVRMIETTVSQRRGLDSERQQKETDEQRQAREIAVARRTAVANEISDTLRAFYCALCDKQFKNVAQYDEHTNSYAHHHKARFKDMQANARIKPQEEIEKRKEKERKREEKELRKIAAASGVKMAKPAMTAAPAAPSAAAPSPSGPSSDTPFAFKSSGWASVSGEANASSSPLSGGLKKSQWASIGPSPSNIASESPKSPGGWSTVSQPTDPRLRTPAFRTGGWTSLESGSTCPIPPPPMDPIPAPPSPDGPTLPAGTRGAIGSTTPGDPPAVLSNRSITMSETNSAASVPPSKSQVSRIGWQQFQKSNSKRKY